MLDTQKFLNQRNFDEGFSSDNPGKNMQTRICYVDICLYLKYHGEQQQ